MRLSRLLTPVSLLLGFLSAQAITPSQVDSIPMRDGKKLAADVYLSPNNPQAPTILIQTPYLRVLYQVSGLPLGIGQSMANCQYNIVIVDWRCFGGSAAACVAQPDRGKDGYDCVQWIASQSWSDGQVGTWGPSALGRVQFLTAVENPPALKCIVPLVAGPQYDYLEYYPGGVLRTEYLEQLDALGFGMSALVMPTTNQTNSYIWQYLETTTDYPDSILVPTFMIGGWYDHTIEHMLSFFSELQTQSPANVQNEHRLLMGPWVHGGHGSAQVGSTVQGQLSYANATHWNDSLAMLFFDYHLRSIANGWNNTPKIQYYQMGQDQWMNTATWPPPGLSNFNLYLHTDSTMDIIAPTASSGSRTFTYNPLDPSPSTGGALLRTDLNQGPYDQAGPVESRNDILTFTTAALPQDVVMKGSVQAHLKISSDHKDTDFDIRLTDVYPDGRSMLVQTGTRRMRFRNGYTAADTAVMTPNTVYDCVIDLASSCITFLAGHKIRIDITSSNYPQYNRNDNSGGILYPGTPPSPDSLLNPQTTVNTVYTNATNTSYVSFPLVSYPSAVVCNSCDETLPFVLNILPNPSGANAQLAITLQSEETLSLSLYDVTGKLSWQSGNTSYHKGSQYVALPAQLPAGMYFLRAASPKGVQSIKWVKQQ